MSIELDDAEREELERWESRWGSAAGLAQRSRIVRACAKGATKTRAQRHPDRAGTGVRDLPGAGWPTRLASLAIASVMTNTVLCPHLESRRCQ
jgi:hypothetical protein